jgi:hypothetical protein
MLISDAFPAIREYCISKLLAGAGYPGQFGVVVYDARRDLNAIRDILVCHRLVHHDEELQLEPLWRVWREDAIDRYDDRWLRDGGWWESPVSPPAVDSALRRYRDNPLIRHPYVSWALMNAYLLGLGLSKRFQLEDRCSRMLQDAGVALLDRRAEPISSARAGMAFYRHATSRCPSDFTAVREMISGAIRSSWSEKYWVALLAVSGFIRSIFLGIVTSSLALAGYGLYRAARRRRQRAYGTAIEKLLREYAPILKASRMAWKGANSSVVDLAELRVRIDDLAREMSEDCSPIKWLVEDAAQRYGPRLDVRTYVSDPLSAVR